MSKFADSLDAQCVDEDQVLEGDSDDVEFIEKRRVIPKLPIRRTAIRVKKEANGTGSPSFQVFGYSVSDCRDLQLQKRPLV